MSAHDEAGEAVTLTAVLDEFAADGYTGELEIDDDTGELLCVQCNGPVDASELVIERSRRLEGASNPSDMATVFAVSCPHCNAKGALVVRYGPEASAGEAELMRRIRDERQSDRDYAPDVDR